MGKQGDVPPKVLNQASTIRLLEANGWTRETGGKHAVKMTKSGHRPITVPSTPGNKDYGPSLRSSILREAGLK